MTPRISFAIFKANEGSTQKFRNLFTESDQ